MNIFKERLGNTMRHFRGVYNMSQEDLAHACGVTLNYIRELERGDKFPSAKMLERISRALKIEPDILFSEKHALKTSADYQHDVFRYTMHLTNTLMSYINEMNYNYVNKHIKKRQNSDTDSKNA